MIKKTINPRQTKERKLTGKTMLLFLDTEFTGLDQADPKLISLALVREDGQGEYYVELTDGWTKADCTGFVIREVLPLLDSKNRKTRSEASAALQAWLTALPEPSQIACDYVGDVKLLKQLLVEHWPEKLDTNWFDLTPYLQNDVYDRAMNRHFTRERPPHHALADAQANRRGWLAWKGAVL